MEPLHIDRQIEALDEAPFGLLVALLVGLVAEGDPDNIIFSEYPFEEFGDRRLGSMLG